MKNIRENSGARLADEQIRAIELLAEGLSDTEVVQAVGIRLEELRVWRRNDPSFIAELNYRRKILWENSTDQLRGLIPHALTALQEVLRDTSFPQRWRAAMEVVKVVGLSPEASHNMGLMVGPDDPKEVERRIR